MQDLLSPGDPDWIEYQAQSTDYLMRVVGALIRDYLGWHLSPSVEETIVVEVGSKGIVMLPSRHVTNVSSVTLRAPYQGDIVLTADDYSWDENGWLDLRWEVRSLWHNMGTNLVEVVFDHGYADVPDDVKYVAYELVQSAETTTVPPGSNVTSMSSPGGYSVSFSAENTGVLSLEAAQMKKLANYRLLGPG